MSPVVKKKGEKFTLPSKYLLFILTIICTIMMILTFSTDLLSEPLNIVASYVVVPFQEGISSVGSYLSNRSKELVQIRDLLSKNENLQKQVDELTIENTSLQQDKYELNNLRELYNLDSQYEDYKKTGARIISKDSGNWYHTFVIDKGSDDGIMVDMSVMAGSGLVGRISEVGTNWAKVVSIISDNSSVSGTVLTSSDNLIINGNLELYEDGTIEFGMLIDEDNVTGEGDKVVTSDISSKYLPGILIGYINTITTDSNNLTKSGTITPAVDFKHLEEVLVIMQLKQTVE